MNLYQMDFVFYAKFEGRQGYQEIPLQKVSSWVPQIFPEPKSKWKFTEDGYLVCKPKKGYPQHKMDLLNLDRDTFDTILKVHHFLGEGYLNCMHNDELFEQWRMPKFHFGIGCLSYASFFFEKNFKMLRGRDIPLLVYYDEIHYKPGVGNGHTIELEQK